MVMFNVCVCIMFTPSFSITALSVYCVFGGCVHVCVHACVCARMCVHAVLMHINITLECSPSK